MAGPRKIDLADVAGLVAGPLGRSSWHTITADQVRGFEAATGTRSVGDEVPPALVASLVPVLFRQIVVVRAFAVNYGLDGLRFGGPVTVGTRVRAATDLERVVAAGDATIVTYCTTIEVEGAPTPACVSHHVSRYTH